MESVIGAMGSVCVDLWHHTNQILPKTPFPIAPSLESMVLPFTALILGVPEVEVSAGSTTMTRLFGTTRENDLQGDSARGLLTPFLLRTVRFFEKMKKRKNIF